MIKTAKIMLLIIIILIAEFSTTSAQDTVDFARKFQDETYLAFVSKPSDSDDIFEKYSINFNREFTEILTNRKEYEKSLINDIILVSAINKNKELFGKINRAYKDHPSLFERETRFYYFRINHERDTNLKYIIAEFDTLLKNPSDSRLIVYLPFLDDIDLSLHYLRKLSSKADGAMAELVWWSANYLYFMNQGNNDALAKIKHSSTYHMFIKNN